jgi:tRNA U34 2-thiouridine synthase MnmA/TrmU
MSKVRALVLLSGGLDSMLAAKVLMEQGIEVVGLSMISNFFNAERAFEATKQLGIPLIAYNISDEHLEMVKKPKHGYGKNMNPCIDCHAMMIAKAKEILEGKEVVLIYPDHTFKAISQTYDFVATGEVLGQRPMSQNARALVTVAEHSGLAGRLVRPLSARLLEVTEPEKAGKIDRESLLDISGRSRARQTELAAQFNLKDYPSPAGGCLLTDEAFGKKLQESFQAWPDTSSNDVQLIKNGRVFWLSLLDEKILLVVARDEKESVDLEKLAKIEGGAVVKLADLTGPTALLRSKNKKISEIDFAIETEIPRELDIAAVKTEFDNIPDLLDVVAMLAGYYSPRARGRKVKLEFKIK